MEGVRRRVAPAVMAVVILVGTACGNGVEAPTAPLPWSPPSSPPSDGALASREIPGPVLSFAPVDLTSAHAGPLRIELDALGAPVAPGLLDSLAASASLVRISTGDVISATITRFNPEARVAPADGAEREAVEEDAHLRQRAYVELTPAEPLLDGWYGISLPAAPSGVRLATKGISVGPGGELNARFARDSRPVVRGVEFCRKENGTQNVYVILSEGVVVPPTGVDAAISISEVGTDRTCSDPMLPNQASVRSTLLQTCNAAYSDRAWRFAFASGINSGAGIGLQTMDGVNEFAAEVDVAGARVLDADCRLWIPEFRQPTVE